MNGPEHYAEAERLIKKPSTDGPVLRGITSQDVALAQVHATLALAATRSDVRVGTLSSDERCHRCGGENVNWCAPSPLWNLVMRGNDINGHPLFNDLVCLRCFVVLAEEAGVRRGQWRLFVDPEPYGLVDETPSGRVWNPETWMWDEVTS